MAYGRKKEEPPIERSYMRGPYLTMIMADYANVNRGQKKDLVQNVYVHKISGGVRYFRTTCSAGYDDSHR